MNDALRDERERGWFHLDNAVIDEYLPKIGVTAFAVYACIVRHSDRAGNAFPSYTLLQKEVKTGRHQVADAVKKLVDAGLVTITTGKRFSNIYHIVTVSTGAAEKLVPQRNQFPSGTDTSSAPAPTLVPQRHQNNTQGTIPREQDPREGERVRANGHAPPRTFGNLVRFPETFEIRDEDADWVRQRHMPIAWVKNRTESFVMQFGNSTDMKTMEAWYDRWRKWMNDDWNRDAKVAQGARR